MPLRPRELIDSLTRAEIEDIVQRLLRREVRKLELTSSEMDTGKRFNAYDGVGGKYVRSTPVTVNLSDTAVNTNTAVFSLSGDQLTVLEAGVLDVTFQVTIGTTGTDEFHFSAVLRLNGAEIARTKGHGGTGIT